MKKLTAFAGAWPFFVAVFLNAFIDLGHKITVQNTIFKLYNDEQQVVATAILNSLILLPFILLLSPAGYISDRYRRVRVMRFSAWLGLGLCGLIAFAYTQGLFELAFVTTFLLAAQSAIYSPAKYALIKEMFGKTRLGEANGVVSALSIVAILAGTFAFSILFEMFYQQGFQNEAEVLRAVAPLGYVLIASAAFEVLMCYRVPLRNAHTNADIEMPPRFAWGKFASGRLFWDDLLPLRSNRSIRLSVIGLATFWSIGQVLLAAFPAFFKSQTGIDNAIAVQGVLACSGIGIALGSYIAGRVSRDHIELGLLPFGAVGIALGLLVLPSLQSATASAINFLIVGFMGGIFIVPLNALIQFQARENELGKTLAANNWVQNVSMFGFLVITALFAHFSLSSKNLLQLIALVALLGCGYTLYQLPQSFVRFLLILIMRGHYRVRVQGMKNIPAQGGALLLGNHVSWIDWAIVQLASPRPIRFVMIRNIYEKWYLKWFFDLFGCIPIEQGARSREALEKIGELLRAGDLVCLFPEGTISRTGHLVEFRKGYERACEGLDKNIPIIPFYLHGLWGSQFSRASSALIRGSSVGAKRDLVVAFGEALDNSCSSDVLKRKIFDLSVRSWQEYSADFESIPTRWIKAAKRQGRRFCMADSTGLSMSGVQALTASTVMARHFKKCVRGRNVGVLLPSSGGAALVNLALLQAGHCVVNLNYTAGLDALRSALTRAEVETLIASKKFLSKLKGKGIDLDVLLHERHVVMVDDMKGDIGLANKISSALLCRLLPGGLLAWLFNPRVSADDTAAILFSSGSEGEPKGVCLSHKNIISNVKQTIAVLNPDQDDVMMGNLPFFHAFGLTVTQFLPLLESVPVIYHPDPTDAAASAKLIARYQATIMFGTSTFLRLYVRNKNVHPLMLQSLRFVVSGAEKLQAQVRSEFTEKFNVDIFEGYGATEATPVVSVNLPDRLSLQDFTVQRGSKTNSVGMPLPGTSIKIVEPNTFEELPTGEAGMVLIGGVQVMQGYLKDEAKTASALYCAADGTRWYITGDKGYLDADGFLYIVDRYSRFAKIGGEMLSLGRIEQALFDLAKTQFDEEAYQSLDLVLVAVPDEKRGEKLILLSNRDLSTLCNTDNFSAQGLSNLALPGQSFVVEAVPKLASGKMDFGRAKTMAMDLLDS